MEAGFSRMNNVTVLQLSQGLAAYILQQKHTSPSIVIGHDHRHNSSIFAQITALAFILKGIQVYYLGPEVVATPLVPFAVDSLSLSCGVMITASHNPALDNGYKVYWQNGCQIIPPHDSNIQNSILLNLEPVPGSWDFEQIVSTSDLLNNVRTEMVDQYLDSVEQKLIKFKTQGLKCVYTPMHGVGGSFAKHVLSLLDLELVIPKEQEFPDPDFPTVSFPNPEEKGALKLAMKEADTSNCVLVLANDPDADRFSAAIKTESGWRQLTGNEIGFLFADYIVQSEQFDNANKWFLNSTVSSQMIKSLAECEGFKYADTLTGFKWIGNKAIDLESEGAIVPFAYEEAIGYMFDVVHDKDGISALAVFLQLYKYWDDQKVSLIDRINNGFVKYGYFKEFNGYYIVPDLDTTPSIFNNIIRKYKDQKPYPTEIGGFKVDYWRDLTIGYESGTSDNKPLLPIDPTSQMITLILKPATSTDSTEFVRFTVRGSGTEPKLKVYIEGKASSESKAQSLAQDVWNLLKGEWFKPDLHNLVERC